ncbi:MAG: ABC transporter ATP-binding protein [Chloroflexi bacterium]|nr:ABC transporter ATP-binding protein [Chloroflexota bacterium]MBU1661403.1 ABC transporter ATP-binding protein [Chloroflexota bacterium]
MNDYVNAVETQQLTKKFGGFTAVDRVDFYIPKGEIFGLLGPNGAGKTTTIRMLCGILEPSGGTGTVLGYDIAKDPEEIKKRIGYMSQKFSLYNDLTAQENIRFYAAIYGVPKKERTPRVDELIEMAGLKGYERELTRNLSGAWRQRLAFACAIAHKPPMLFLDEATAGVDPVSRREFWDLIYAMAGQGVSVLATTHYMDEAEYCNTIGMMYRGELIALASPDELKARMPGTLLQVDCANPAQAESVLDSLPEVIGSSLHGAQLHVVLKSPGKEKKIRRALTSEGIKVHHIEEIQPSLEDVFISMVEDSRTQVDDH